MKEHVNLKKLVNLKRQISLNKHVNLKKYISRSIAVFFLYVVSGILLAYGRHPDVSRKYIDTFNPDAFYSDQVSCDRACVIEDNKEALLERLRMIERADERIILSTFDFQADESGKDILAALLNAATERNVDVKILVDGYSAATHMTNNAYFMALSTLSNVEIKIYNPINLLKPWNSMGRLHDKYIIIDNELYILGGRNTNDNFLGDYESHKNYDRDILVYNTDPSGKESSLYELCDYFDTIWNLKVCKYYHDDENEGKKKKVVKAREELKEIYKSNIEKYPFLMENFYYREITYAVNKISFLTNPVHIHAKEPTLFYSLTQLMKNAKEEVKIHTPYIICNDMMYEALTDVCSGQAKVTLMTNSPANNDNPFGASDYILHKNNILKTGIKIYEYEGGISYHGKSITIDDDIAIIGSFNMDLRSAYLSTEIMAVVDSEDINRQLKGYMSKYEEYCAYVIDRDRAVLPEGVKRQKFTVVKGILVKLIILLNGFRFLM